MGQDILLRGAITGPYSMAAELVGAEKFVLLTMDDPEFARQVLEFCARVALEFGKAFLSRGVQPIIFDSRATPKMASPRVFRSMVLPAYKDILMPGLKSAGAKYLPLIVGGNTTAIIDDLIATGATQHLSDHPANLAKWCEKSLAAGVAVRANVDALLVNRGPVEAVRKQAVGILKEFHAQPGFMLGCGVVAYDGPAEMVHEIRRTIDDLAAGTLDFERELATQP
jgi:uroporphyrinogen decarboxylase